MLPKPGEPWNVPSLTDKQLDEIFLPQNKEEELDAYDMQCNCPQCSRRSAVMDTTAITVGLVIILGTVLLVWSLFWYNWPQQ